MIDPSSVDGLRNYERTDYELQEFFLFSVFVANKPAFITARKTDQFLSILARGGEELPFQMIARAKPRALRAALEEARIGQYTRITPALHQAARLDLRTAGRDALVTVPGVGYKTASFFLVYSRPAVQYAVLDTHVLKHLRDLGIPGVPTSTPTSRTAYLCWERVILNIAREVGLEPSEYDYRIWSRYKGASVA